MLATCSFTLFINVLLSEKYFTNDTNIQNPKPLKIKYSLVKIIIVVFVIFVDILEIGVKCNAVANYLSNY